MKILRLKFPCNLWDNFLNNKLPYGWAFTDQINDVLKEYNGIAVKMKEHTGSVHFKTEEDMINFILKFS